MTEYAKNAVIELSKMMRYVLYESGHEIISLNRDIQFVQNYIGLMRIRYTDAVDIRVEYPHDLPPQVSIPPLLLIVFVENAFKHGVSYSKPSFIHMRIDYADGKVVSTIGNSLHSPQAEKHNAGIGLENVRKRLSLIYGPKNYSLVTSERRQTACRMRHCCARRIDEYSGAGAGAGRHKDALPAHPQRHHRQRGDRVPEPVGNLRRAALPEAGAGTAGQPGRVHRPHALFKAGRRALF